MTGLSMDSNLVRLDLPGCSHLVADVSSIQVEHRDLFLSLSPSKPASDSQPTLLGQQSLVEWSQVMLLCVGLFYAISSMAGEYFYASGFGNRYVVFAVSDLRDAAQTFPLNYQFRKGSAQYLTAVAVDQKNPEWTKAALSEIYAAIDADPTSADLLNSMRVFEVELGKQPTHVAMYDLLAGKSGKRVK